MGMRTPICTFLRHALPSHVPRPAGERRAPAPPAGESARGHAYRPSLSLSLFLTRAYRVVSEKKRASNHGLPRPTTGATPVISGFPGARSFPEGGGLRVP